jgi:hypothetical protein
MILPKGATVKLIPLTQGKFSIVDDLDFDLLSKFKWHIDNAGYAKRWVYQKTVNGKRLSMCELMHRAIMSAPIGMDIDHVNGNRLDNRRSNLRICSRPQNSMNRGSNKNNTTGYKCVWPARGRFKTCVTVNKRRIYLGSFGTAAEAHAAYESAAKQQHGSFYKNNTITKP